MKDHFRYAYLRPFGDEKLVSHCKLYLSCMAVFAFLISALGSVASGFLVWQWLPIQFSLFSLGIILITFTILWLLSTKLIIHERPEALKTTQKLHTIFFSHRGWAFNWRFWMLIAFSVFTAPTLFTLSLLPAIDQFNQQQFANEKILRLQKSESDYSQNLKLLNKDIEEERNTFDLLVNEEDGEDINNINLTVKSLEHLEEEKFHLLQEFSQEDSQLKQSTLTSPRSLFNLSLPSNISRTQKALLENQTHWKYSALKFSCLFFPVSLVITLLLFKLFQPKLVSHYLNQQLKIEIMTKPINISIHTPTNNESALPVTSLLSSNSENLPSSPEPSLQKKTSSPDKITLLKEERVIVLSEIKSLEHSFNSQDITKEQFIQKLNTLDQNRQTLSNKILKMLLNDAKTALATYSD